METTTPATKTRTAKHAAAPINMPDYGIAKFEMPKFNLPKMEMPEAYREMAEQGVEYATDAFATAKVATNEAADLLEKTYKTAARHATNYNQNLIEIARANTRSTFDYVDELLRAKSLSEFVELSMAQMRKQFDIASAQNKELYKLAQEIATEAADTIRTSAAKAIKRGMISHQSQARQGVGFSRTCNPQSYLSGH